jgi:tRNA pseudouridine55 synthase
MFYLINKPTAFTSFDVIRKLRKITGIKKMGHTGTLDPLATGWLLIATDNSTKLISRLENCAKTYVFTVDVSITSPSLDLEWNITPVDISTMQDHSNDAVASFLMSQISQLPPKYSAIHIWGKRAYDLVRKWVEFDIEQRPIEVSHVEILDKVLPKITIRLTISAGGYIRSFAPIIGDFFWVPGGGCITYLHREKVGDIDLSNAMGFDDFDIKKIVPYHKIFAHIREYHLDPVYKKPLIDWLVLDIGSPAERNSKEEILIYCDDICSLAHWTPWGIEVIKNYV